MLRGQRLSDKLCLEMLNVVRDSLKYLDLSYNPSLTYTSYEYIADILDDYNRVELRTLLLEGNNCGDRALKGLCKMLESNDQLSFLNISQNNICDVGAEHIAMMLRFNIKISVLFMRWNKITSKGGVLLCHALRNNNVLQIWDASFNSFGSAGAAHALSLSLSSHSLLQSSASAPQLPNLKASAAATGTTAPPSSGLASLGSPLQGLFGKERGGGSDATGIGLAMHEMFESNKTLVHVDFTQNSLRRHVCQLIAEGLQKNHTILGIHMLGNDVDIDPRGFL